MADVGERKRPQFGGRFLTDPTKVFQHNAWDNVSWDAEQEAAAKQKVKNNTKTKVSEEQQKIYEEEAAQYWDDFYSQHQNRFFKDRHWLFLEFPELAPNPVVRVSSSANSSEEQESVLEQHSAGVIQNAGCESDNQVLETEAKQPSSDSIEKQDELASAEDNFPGSTAAMRIFEVGCGVGNTILPVLRTNNNPDLFVYGCDLSSQAVEILKEQADYDPRRCHVFVCDVTDPKSKLPFPKESLDIIVLIFVLSAINPERFQFTIDRLASYLKPGGTIVFRDYGRYDLAQLRFKDGQCLGDNFYVRGDGTRVYFFTQEELRDLFTTAGLTEVQNIVDRRLQVNRGRQLKMYRVWIQCKYRKDVNR